LEKGGIIERKIPKTWKGRKKEKESSHKNRNSKKADGTKKEKNESLPRPGGNFAAPGKK
jgi:hypothetical protein